MKKLYGEIAKTEELDDGTIKVWGFASSESVDSDGETITSGAMKAALPDYLKFGAVREMHQAKAAGTAIEAEVQEDGRTWFGAHIVDSEAVKKVKAQVYKGFSIGGRVTERDKGDRNIIKGLKLVEVSLVDRPANPEAVLTFFKSEGVEQDDAEIQKAAVDTLAAMLDAGEVTPTELIALAKAAKGAAADDKVAKGMGHVSQLASLLRAVLSLTLDQVDEAAREGDDSAIPAQLKAWLSQGGEILVSMCAEEVGEMSGTAADPNAAGPNYGLYLSDKATSLVKSADTGTFLAKAGAKFSSDTKKKLGDVHKAAKDCCDHLDKLGYAGGATKADEPDGLTKAELDKQAAEHAEALSKAEADRDKANADADALRKRVTELEATPAHGKALLKAVSKGADTLVDESADALAKAEEEAMKGLKGEALAQYQIKKMYRDRAAGLV